MELRIKTLGPNTLVVEQAAATNSSATDIGKVVASQVAWGGRPWKTHVESALRELEAQRPIRGSRVLDIGTRHGEMAMLFAMLGAKVTGIDINQEPLEGARRTAESLGLTSQVEFLKYDGDLDIFPDESFDVVFTKSVLVLVPHMQQFLQQISAKLRPGGQIVFIENGKGNWLLHALRWLRHRRWNYSAANFFTRREIDWVRQAFKIRRASHTWFPPIFLFVGSRREPLPHES